MEQLRLQKCEQTVTLVATFLFSTWRRRKKGGRLPHSLAFVFRSSHTTVDHSGGGFIKKNKQKKKPQNGKERNAHENAESEVLAEGTDLGPKHVAPQSSNH